MTDTLPAHAPPALEIQEILRGQHANPFSILGLHEGDGAAVVRVFAPEAAAVTVIDRDTGQEVAALERIDPEGFFSGSVGQRRRHPMRRRYGAGVWELFIPALGEGALYKYEIRGVHGDLVPLKADPVGFAAEQPPATASIISGLPEHDWQDGDWMRALPERTMTEEPVSIYEVHPGSWRGGEGDRVLSYDELAGQLAGYATDMGFTHIEFMPVSEHPFTGSWGYQPIGMFAPTARHGSPAHFPSDAHGLARFDGTALYEHEDPRLGFHNDWNTLIYNFGRVEVANFLRASALYWLREFHVDALRVDAVASMLYLDYSRDPGEWVPNRFGGRENLDAINFLRRTNTTVTLPPLSTLILTPVS